jgi:Bacterial toxin 23
MAGTEFDQKIGKITIGGPLNNFSYENDQMPLADKGDRHRTAALQINAGMFNAGFTLFTGEPLEGTDGKRITHVTNGQRYYTEDKMYRSGVLYAGAGGFRIGRNSEQIRNVIQNKFAHGFLKGKLMGKPTPYFEIDPSRKPKWYWGYDNGSGDTLY